MSRDFDNFPTYDPIVKDQVYLSNIWSDFMATFIESLREYLNASGVFVPRLTIEQRNQIQAPQQGQMIYVMDKSTSIEQLQIWQVVAGVGQWTVIV